MEKVKVYHSEGLFNPYAMSTAATTRNNALNRHTDAQVEVKEQTFRYINNSRRIDKQDQPELKNQCTCERKMMNILCRSCGNVFYGRIRYLCPVHPNVVHLMDISSCPKCKAGLLKEFQTTKGTI